MNKLIKLVMAGLLATSAFALPAFAQDPVQPAAANASQGQCTEENKRTVYEKFTANRKDHPEVSYQAGKQYLEMCASEADDQYKQYIKKWIAAYDKSAVRTKLSDLLNSKPPKFAEAIPVARQVLNEDPENLRLLFDLAKAGYIAASSKQTANNADAVAFAKRALQLTQSGKTIEGVNNNDVVGQLNYILGFLSLENAPNDAVDYLIKAVQTWDYAKKSPLSYLWLGIAYEQGRYPKVLEAFKPFVGKEESAESKAAQANLNAVVDRIIDAYARAIALSGSDPAYASQKAAWTESLTTYYKFRHENNDAGLKEFLAQVVNTPLPTPPVPVTAQTMTPSDASSTTPGGTSTSTPGQDGKGTTTTPVQPTTKPASTPANTKPASTTTKPATPSPTPTKPTSPRKQK